jgi:pimeloyl-ACP methyl ester carboxylesterase
LTAAGRVSVDRVSLEYEITGQGEPVLLIHGMLIANGFVMMMDDPALAGRYRFVTYHRQGYHGSGRALAPPSIVRMAEDAAGLIRHLGIERVHVLGHSLGGTIALQLALTAPELVATLVVQEPPLPTEASAPEYKEAILRADDAFKTGRLSGIVDALLAVRFGAGYRDYLDKNVPGGFEAGVAHAHTAINIDLPSLIGWQFGEDEARRITQPVLAVLGGDSAMLTAFAAEAHEDLLRWLPNVQGYVLPGTTHAMHFQNPHGMAVALAEFLARHPLD